MKNVVAVSVLAIGALIGMAFTFGSPPAPQPIHLNAEWAHFDVQVHNRDTAMGWDYPFQAQHGPDCGAPPATHTVSALADGVFICNDHVMTAANSVGYGMIALTPSQTVNCLPSCTIQWDMSTERQSVRDWPDVWVTPWLDNLTLPFDVGDVDLQGVPRQGVHINLNNSQSAWFVQTITNYNETTHNDQYGATIQTGIVPGTNQAAVRQTFKLTLTGGNYIRLERLASATATAIVYFDGQVNPFPTTDLVVQFAHHSYNPTKDFAGVPATWHWSGFNLSPATPFTLIHQATGSMGVAPPLTSAGTVAFDAPAPANAYLRFSAVCTVAVDGVVAPKQAFLGHPEHASSYFIPIAQGKQSVNVSFSPDSWYGGSCYAQDFAVWSKGGSQLPPTPTPTPISASPTPSASATASATAVISPTPTPTSTPTSVPPTSTSTPTVATPTSTPAPTRQCTLRWGGNTIENYGQLTQAECAARGQ